MRLRLFKHDYHVDDIDVITSRFCPDTERVEAKIPLSSTTTFLNKHGWKKLDGNETTHTHQKQISPRTCKEKPTVKILNVIGP